MVTIITVKIYLIHLNMEKKILSCKGCPNKCQLEIEIEDGEVLDVTGNRCMKGYAYAQEIVNSQENEL